MMFAIQTISQALLEIPTGVLSDKYSRILNLRLSAFLWFISYFFTALSGSVSQGTAVLIFASIIGGLAGSLNSGTKEALIYETLTDCRKQSKFSVVFSRIMFWEQIGAIFGALIAVGTMFLFDLVSYSLYRLSFYTNQLQDKNQTNHLSVFYCLRVNKYGKTKNFVH